MNEWFREIATSAWDPIGPAASPTKESPASACLGAALPFRPSRRPDDPRDGNVWTLRNGECLDTPERFFDWLECYQRDHIAEQGPRALDRLVECRRTVEVRANQRRHRLQN